MKILGHCQPSLRYTKRLRCDQPLIWIHLELVELFCRLLMNVIVLCWKSNGLFCVQFLRLIIIFANNNCYGDNKFGPGKII